MNNNEQFIDPDASRVEGEGLQATPEEIGEAIKEMTDKEKLDLANETIAELNAKVAELEGQLKGSPEAVSLGRFNLQKMAEEANCLDLYRFAYTPFSSSVHNMWNHVSRYNLIVCTNPLHRLHKIPIDPDMPMDMDYLYRAAKYVEKAFNLFDRKIGIKIKMKSSFKKLKDNLDRLEIENHESSAK